MRPLVAKIRLNNLRHNYIECKKMHGNKALAVIKANAYGHGAIECARALEDIADGFAVATIEEAISLRQAGITLPVVMLEGVFELSEYALVDEYNLWPVVQNENQLQGFLAYSWTKPVKVWLKMDSGMHRAGFFPADYANAHQRLSQSPWVDGIVKMTHFARADEEGCNMTAEQIATFDAVCSQLPGEESLANSAAILAHPKAHRDWGRIGLSLYGLSPFGVDDARLKPVMQLETQVFGVRELAAGEVVGYGSIFKTEKPSRIGLMACGYADGYPRLASNDSPIAIDGVLSRVAGRVSMDMMTIELNRDEQGIGSHVELWGDQVSINAVAAMAGTISYELLCNIKRARFEYVK
jgi:alanine racemase